MMIIKSLVSKTVPYARCYSETNQNVLKIGDKLRHTKVFLEEDVAEYSKAVAELDRHIRGVGGVAGIRRDFTSIDLRPCISVT